MEDNILNVFCTEYKEKEIIATPTCNLRYMHLHQYKIYGTVNNNSDIPTLQQEWIVEEHVKGLCVKRTKEWRNIPILFPNKE